MSKEREKKRKENLRFRFPVSVERNDRFKEHAIRVPRRRNANSAGNFETNAPLNFPLSFIRRRAPFRRASQIADGNDIAAVSHPRLSLCIPPLVNVLLALLDLLLFPSTRSFSGRRRLPFHFHGSSSFLVSVAVPLSTCNT